VGLWRLVYKDGRSNGWWLWWRRRWGGCEGKWGCFVVGWRWG
jgi:hypothetical protein